MREISIIKSRILEYLDKQGITKYECYRKTGITNGVFSQSTGISEDNLLKFLSYYSNISLHWLFTGGGDMLERQERPTTEPKEVIIYRSDPKDLELIELQREHIKLLKEQLTLGPARLDLNAPSTDPTPTPIPAFAPPKRAKNTEKHQ